MDGVIGDAPRDTKAGWAAGVKGLLLGDGRAAWPGAYSLGPDLAQAARLIMVQCDRQMTLGRQISLPEVQL